MARNFHPDLHPNDKEAEGKFKDISAAHDLLKDKEKRRRFDLVKLMPAARSGRRSGSTATSRTTQRMPRTQPRTDLPPTRNCMNFLLRRSKKAAVSSVARSRPAAMM